MILMMDCLRETDFYPRPHVEGDEQAQKAALLMANFYPRPHVEGDSWLV